MARHWKSMRVIMPYCKESYQAVFGIGCIPDLGWHRAGTRPAPTGDLGRDGRYCMLLLRGHLWSAQGGADSGDEFGGGEGFDYVVYGA